MHALPPNAHSENSRRMPDSVTRYVTARADGHRSGPLPTPKPHMRSVWADHHALDMRSCMVMRAVSKLFGMCSQGRGKGGPRPCELHLIHRLTRHFQP